MSSDEMYDETAVHAGFLSGAVNGTPRHGVDAAARAVFGPNRLRSIAVIASGGLAFAALGAFLGGLGSEVAVSPAAAHPLTSSHLNVPPGSAALVPANPPFRAGTWPQAAVPAGSGAATPSTSNDGSPVAAASASASATSVSGGPSDGGPLLHPVTDGATIPAVPLPIAAPQPVTQIVSQLGLSGAVAGLGQTVTGIASSIPAPNSGLATVTTPLTGVVTNLTSSLTSSLTGTSGSGGSSGAGGAPICVSTPALPIPTGGGFGLPTAPVGVSVCVTP
jgi:hypothetical protein